jgi:hypothetical protein
LKVELKVESAYAAAPSAAGGGFQSDWHACRSAAAPQCNPSTTETSKHCLLLCYS